MGAELGAPVAPLVLPLGDALALGSGLPPEALVAGLPNGAPLKSDDRKPVPGVAVPEGMGDGAADAAGRPDFLWAPCADVFTCVPEGTGVGAEVGPFNRIET